MSPTSDLVTPGRRERAKAEKRARILDAARRLLDERGYDGMTMAEVARDADVAIGTVFQYAATKAELLMMVVAHRWAARVPTLGVGGGDPVEAVVAVFAPLVEDATSRPDLMTAAARELLFGRPGPHRQAVLDLVTTMEDRIADVVRAAGGGECAGPAARLIVSGALLELDLTRDTPGTGGLDDRIRRVVTIAVAGACAAHARDSTAPPA